jgi:SPP1 family predicted phage head-tail adaptor
MQAGKLNKRVTIKRLTETSDSYGGTVSTVADYVTIWADKKELGGEVKNENGQRTLYNDIELTIRKKTADVIRYDDIFSIEGDANTYRINEIFDSKEDFFTTIRATKIA